MDAQHNVPRPKAYRLWDDLISQSLLRRLSSSEFTHLAQKMAGQNVLSSPFIAEIVLRPPPPPRSCRSPEPLAVEYALALFRLHIVDAFGLLAAMYKYTSLHEQAEKEERSGQKGPQQQQQPPQQQQQHHQATGKGKAAPWRRWQSSYTTDEIFFAYVRRDVAQGGLQVPFGAALYASRLLGALVGWARLFNSADAALPPDAFGPVHNLHERRAFELARTEFAALLLGVCSTSVALDLLRKHAGRSMLFPPPLPPHSSTRAVLPHVGGSADWLRGQKGIRKALADGLRLFVPALMQTTAQMPFSPSATQPPAELAGQLELMQTQTLASFEPDDKKEADDAGINSYMGLVELENVQIAEVPVVNSRAGLYIYLNAAVGRRRPPLGRLGGLADRVQLVGRPLTEDGALETFLHNRYQVG